MGYRTISLSNEAYKRLASLKREGESFTDVVLRLCSKASRKPLAGFAGSWIMSGEEEMKIFGEISELWWRGGKSFFPDIIIGSPTMETWGIKLDLKRGDIVIRGASFLL